MAASRRSDVETETMPAFGGEEVFGGLGDDALNLGFASELEFGAKFAEEVDDLALFKVKTFYFVVDAATVDGRPIDDAFGATGRIANVFLLEDFGQAGAVLAIPKELPGGDVGAADLIDFFDEAAIDGVLDGDPIVAPEGRGRLRIEGGGSIGSRGRSPRRRHLSPERRGRRGGRIGC